MAGSKGRKHSKGKGKSKSNKSDTINKKLEVFDSKFALGESNNNPDRLMDTKDENPYRNVSNALSKGKCSERELEEFLYRKLEELYAKAKDRLLKSGYSMAEVETAILSAGYIYGHMDLLNNILSNSIAFIEKRIELTGEAFKDMGELCKSMLEFLVKSVMQILPGIQRFDAMWHLFVRNWGCVPSTTKTSDMQSGDQNMHNISSHGSYGSSSHSKTEDAGALGPYSVENIRSELNADSSLKKAGIMKRINFTPTLESYLAWNVHILTADIHKKIGAPVIMQQAIPTEVSDIESSDFLKRWLESNSDEPKTAVVVELVKSIRNLQEKVKEQKGWAQKKVVDSARRLSKDFLELKMLRIEMMEKEKIKNEKLYAEKSCKWKLMEMGQSLEKVNLKATFTTDAVRHLKIKNAQIRADSEALKLDESESERELKEVLKREKKCIKKLSDVGKQISNFRSQYEAEKQRVLQLELELLQAEEAEVKWRQEIEEKEHMSALLAEEIKMADIQKANLRAELLKLRQKLEIESQIERDDHQRLEEELSRLRISQQTPNALPEDLNFLYDDAEATTSESSAPTECSEKTFRHWICMICLQNEVSMVLLPCTHQVICFHCYERNCKTVGAWCPYCHVKIEDSIRVFGPSS